MSFLTLDKPKLSRVLSGPLCVTGGKKITKLFQKDEYELDCDSQMILRFSKCICGNDSNLFPPKG